MAKRFVSIWLPYLATDWFTRLKPELKKIPFVLSAPSHGRIVITSANPLSQKKGIYPGMALADARAIHSSLQSFNDKPKLQSQLLQRIAEWCIRFTPSAAVDPLGGIILDASGCTHLWGNDESYVKELLARLNQKGYEAKAAIADTIGAAWAHARFGNSHVIEPGKQLNSILSLPPAALRLDEDTLEKLYTLGLTRIKDFISFPRSALRRRFGMQIIQRLNQALGTEQEFIQPVCTPEPYMERLPCPESILGLQGIELALQRLLEQLCNRLRKEGKGLRTASFRGYRTDNKTTGIQISTARPSNNADHLFRLFQLKLSAFEPGLGIKLFLLEATTIEKHAPMQEGFWKESSGLQNYKIAELIDRISNKMGACSIYRYLPEEHYWPERSVRKTSSLHEMPSTGWISARPRPLQLLTIPESIEVTAPIPDYPPMLFRYKGKLHKITRADGPERIEQEWWIEEGQHRDYYVVEDEEGCRYWLFRSGHYNVNKTYQWFIHGFFA